MKKRLVYCILSTIFFSCNISQKENPYLVKSLLNKDSSGYILNYYNDGGLMDSIEYLNGKRNGWTCFYSKKGEKTYMEYYFKGIRNGWSIYYYDNGKTYKEELYINNKPFGDYQTYYKDGSLKTYNCIDFEGDNRRVKIYDSNGNVVKNEGKVIGQAMIYSNNSVFKVGQNILIDFVVSRAPNEKVRTWIFENNNYKEYFFSGDNIITFRKIYYKEGNYKIYAIGESVDTITHVLLKDTMAASFKVVH